MAVIVPITQAVKRSMPLDETAITPVIAKAAMAII
jgi:hypothetical protein